MMFHRKSMLTKVAILMANKGLLMALSLFAIITLNTQEVPSTDVISRLLHR